MDSKDLKDECEPSLELLKMVLLSEEGIKLKQGKKLKLEPREEKMKEIGM